MTAAAKLIEYGADVTVFEKNDRTGLKLGITGKGRCNLTNNCTREEFMANIPTNPRFLYSAFSAFTPADTMEFFENMGVPLKTERGNRVFPVSDRAGDIVHALRDRIKGHVVNRRVTGICTENGRVTGITAGGKFLPFDAVILCTGGMSYPKTGSDGDGYRFAKALGHTVTSLRPSLVPIESPDRFCAGMQGLSLKNVAVSVTSDSGRGVYRDFGEMMFTHFGVTGPVILSASSMIPDLAPGKYILHIDLKPALDEKTLGDRLLSDFSKNINRDFANSLGALLPAKMIPVMIGLSGIDPDKKVNEITKEERLKFVRLIKAFPLTLNGLRDFNEAIITKGGVKVSEVNPSTMESKLVRHLYFCGEVLDLDALTGGFNLQIAWSTGHLAGMCVE